MDLVDELLPNMRRVMAVDRDLHDLGLLWTLIEASSAIGCPEEAHTILPTLSQTRQRFIDLRRRLVQQLGREHLAELADELGATAQSSIDILVRNLFERTADVGFLATDAVLRVFCAADAGARAASAAAIASRLAEYRSKYSVYDDIIMLASDGSVLARLDSASALTRSSDPLVAQALAQGGYVERHGPSDLGAGAEPALLYAHRVQDPSGRVLGVLVLRFRLADEMQRIFGEGVRNRRQACVVLLDGCGCVVLSSDPAQVALGSRPRVGASDAALMLLDFAGREYLATLCTTRGYQGYRGPGWRALAMVPLTSAFRVRAESAETAQGVALENPELLRIQGEIESINRNLRRVIWNGRLAADSRGGARAQLKAVLQQVSDASVRMRERAGQAVQDLYLTSLGRAQQQSTELARLAADIMDRNLYERANDCRWWALSPVLQQVLAEAPSRAGSDRLNAVLSHINSLYTVYTRLAVFDATGLLRGISNDDPEQPLLGTSLAPGLLQATLALSDSQRYAVSAFEAQALSSGEPTYVYLAAVRAAGAAPGCPPLGGIAIVFNAQREFKAILDDVMEARAGCALFVDGAGRVIAATDPAMRPGSTLPFAASQPAQQVLEHGGAHHAVATVEALGYREFKHHDAYRNDIRAVVALRLGALDKRGAALADCSLTPLPHAAGSAGPAAARPLELALFQVGAGRYALPVSAVLEARPRQSLVRTGQGGALVVGLLDIQGGVVPVLCARKLFGLHHPARESDGTIIVLNDPLHPTQALCGLRVDDLASVLEVSAVQVQPVPAGLRHSAPWLAAVVRLQTAADPPLTVLAQLLDAGALLQLVQPRQAAQQTATEGLAPTDLLTVG